MARTVRIALLLGIILCLLKSQTEGYKISRNHRKEAKYGRPVLAMANSPRCLFNGRQVEDGRTVTSPEPCLNCTCSRGILLCYLRTCATVIATNGCEVVRKKGECCPELECKDPSEYRTDKINEPSYTYRLRQDESNFFGLIGSDPRTEKYNSIKTTRRPAPKIENEPDDWMSSEISNPSDELQALVEQEEDYESDRLSADKNDSTRYCYHKGYKYTDGMAMLSPTKCEYCYCIRGQQMCVRPKCHLNIDGCIARYQSGYTCCPSHYQCEIGVQNMDGDGYQFDSTLKPDQIANKVTSCTVEGYDFDVGVAVPSSGRCQACYCTQYGVVCRRLECSASVPGCTPIVPEGHCCPTEYKCDQQGSNDTQVPIPHSTENYDVTVIPPSDAETVSSQTSETETTVATDYDYTDNYTSDSHDQETTTDDLSDKQKITVELNDESNLESISVIPEENIAVLVVTTEKANDKINSVEELQTTQIFHDTTKKDSDGMPPIHFRDKPKSTTARGASIITDRTQYSQDTTKPIIISLPNLKQKTKPTSNKGTTLMHASWYTHVTTRPSFLNFKSTTKGTTAKNNPRIPGESYYTENTTKPLIIPLPNLKYKTKATTTNTFSTTTKTDKMDYSTPAQDMSHNLGPSTEATKFSIHEDSNFKDNYSDDYADLYEDAAPVEHETFAPFADYSEPVYGERLSSTEKVTLNEKLQGMTENMRFKNKNKKPPFASQTNNLITSTIPSFTNSKFAPDGLTTSRIIETETYHDSLSRSTVPVTMTDKSDDYPTRYTIYSVPSDKTKIPFSPETIIYQKHKLKPNRPEADLNTKYITTKDTTSFESTIPQVSTRIYVNPEHQTTLDNSYYDREIGETNIPSLHTHITSNHKQKPQRLQTTMAYKTTQPLPEEIAELLWTITQKQSAQTQIASTETYEPSKQEIPESSQFSPDNLSLILAAPKLIVEDTTPHENQETVKSETTNSDVLTSDYNPINESSVPSLMFNAPEIIFSNHGPTSHRKQPLPVRDYHIPSLQAVRGPGLTNLQTVKNTGLQTLKNPTLQTVKNSGLQSVKNTGQYGMQNVRDPGVSNIQTVKDTGYPGIIKIRDPGFSDVQSIRDAGYPSIQNQQQTIFPGPQINRSPGPPLEINNHKKTLRPRPPSRFRLPSTTSVPKSTIFEISNHRPINPFRRPSPTKFPPYPSYNQRSEPEYRSQQKPRDPHHSLHYLASDLHPEWRDEEYDEYYYDFEQGRSPTKIFSNMKNQQTTQGEDSMENINSDYQSPSSQKTTRQSNLNLSTTTTKDDEDQNDLKFETTIFSGGNIETKPEEIESRASDIKVTDTPTKITEMPFSTTVSYSTANQISNSSTNPSSIIKTSDSSDDQLFRSESGNKNSNGDLKESIGQYEGKVNEFEERPNKNKPKTEPIPVVSERPMKQSTLSPPSEEDSKEINDVCFVDGRYYNSGEIIVKTNPCEMCRCFYGHPLCQVQQCPSPPEPSCVLEYLPGYCCPRVTCGVKVDSSQPPDVSAPDPTNQEIKPPLITSDNQWKPLPHGPIVRPPEKVHQVLTPSPETVPDVVTAPPQMVKLDEKTKEDSIKETELSAEMNFTFDNLTKQDETATHTAAVLSTITSTATAPVTTQSTTTTTQKIEITTYFPEITTEQPTEAILIFRPEPEGSSSEQNSSEIHDNSSGVRKVLDETITLPPSKMSLSPNSAENISTVLPVIQTLSPSSTDSPGLELDTVPNVILGDLPAELGGNLKVSGCNVYGKYYKINDKVTVLSKNCRECICSPDGIACNATC